MKNFRTKRPTPTTHPDFEYRRGLPKGSRVDTNSHWVKLKKKIDSGYFDFAICFWGNLGQIRPIDSKASGNVFYVKGNVAGVKESFENIDWNDLEMVSAGARQITTDMMIEKYAEYIENA
jgi:hypothetical protein